MTIKWTTYCPSTSTSDWNLVASSILLSSPLFSCCIHFQYFLSGLSTIVYYCLSHSVSVIVIPVWILSLESRLASGRLSLTSLVNLGRFPLTLCLHSSSHCLVVVILQENKSNSPTDSCPLFLCHWISLQLRCLFFRFFLLNPRDSGNHSCLSSFLSFFRTVFLTDLSLFLSLSLFFSDYRSGDETLA